MFLQCYVYYYENAICRRRNWQKLFQERHQELPDRLLRQENRVRPPDPEQLHPKNNPALQLRVHGLHVQGLRLQNPSGVQNQVLPECAR